MELKDYRTQIDEIDDELVKLFKRRMDVSTKIAGYKKEKSLPVFVPSREREKLADVAEKAGPEMANYTRVLYSMLFELSRSHQNRLNGNCSPLFSRITEAIETTPQLFPQSAKVACQGVEGSYSQIACEKLFSDPFLFYFKNFEGVFAAVDKGLCQYGIVPLENTSSGSAKSIYDLIVRHGFSVVRTFRMNTDHNLLAKSGTEISQIREIYSHQRAIDQCRGYLSDLTGVTVTPVANTAIAAEMVSKSARNDVAAISSRNCMELYDLDCLAPSIQDKGNHYTRFVCISKKLEIYPGADITSIMMILPHRPGSLYKLLARLYVLGINVAKLESRPIPERDFEFMFYLDLQTSVYSEEFAQLMCELDDLCVEFQYLGSYREITS